MMVIIGIDAGGTKTIACAYDENGKILASESTTTCHYLQVGFDGMEERLSKLLVNIKEKLDVDNIHYSFGMAGYGELKEERFMIEKIIAKICEPHTFDIYNDVEIAMAGALGGKDGIVMIAGTGSIAFSKFKEKTKRCGGWGYQVGDEASAYWIANKLLSAFSKQADGRSEKTLLYKYVKDSLCLKNDYDIISYVSNVLEGKREKIAELAPLVYDLAKQEEPSALAIYEEVAKEISLTVNTLAKDNEGEEILLSYIGGVWKSLSILEPFLEKYLNTKVRLTKPVFSAEYGAYLLGKDGKV